MVFRDMFKKQENNFPPMPQPRMQMPSQLNISDVPQPPQMPLNMMAMPSPNLEMPTLQIPDKIPELDEKPRDYVYEQRSISEPMFIQLDNFRKVLLEADNIIAVEKASARIFNTINEMKNREDTMYNHFSECIEECQRKMVYLDKNVLR